MCSLHLVSASTGEVFQIPVGESAIGRGPLLKVTDKRVSRSHALLRVTADGKASICPKHKNPCFYGAAGRPDLKPLTKDKWQCLAHGDIISLLPSDLIFSVRHAHNTEATPPAEPDLVDALFEQQEVEQSSEQLPGSGGLPKPAPLLEALPASSARIVPDTAKGVAPEANRDPGAGQDSESKVQSQHSSKARRLPAWLLAAGKQSTAPATARKKQSHAPVGLEEKPAEDKAKPSAPETTQPALEAKDPRTSVSQNKQEECPVRKALPPCPYGTACYRKNPVHFTEYSHDSGDTSDEHKPECPYGTSCYRRNPQHHKEYRHTAATGTKQRGRAAKRRRGSGEEDEGPNTYDCSDSFIDDEDISEGGSSSEKGSSSDEEWAPLEEDVGELLTEASAFLRSKKH